MTIYDEQTLREKACEWLRYHFPRRRYDLGPLVFHNMGLTLSQFLFKKFKGSQLTSIPHYKELAIRPDIIALLRLKSDCNDILEWVVGECKVNGVSAGELGQAVRYANASRAYEAYLFYQGELSRETIEAIKAGGHLYDGTNRWGKIVKKRIVFVKYHYHKFSKIIF